MNKTSSYTRNEFKKDCSKIVGSFLKGDKNTAEKILEHATLSLLSKKIEKAAKKSKLF